MIPHRHQKLWLGLTPCCEPLAWPKRPPWSSQQRKDVQMRQHDHVTLLQLIDSGNDLTTKKMQSAAVLNDKKNFK
jgi:hypothetical protein